MELNWQLKKFDELTPYELYAIIQLRNEVFVVEQNCPFQDADNKDQPAWHFMGWDVSNKLMAYTRLLEPGISYEQASIGRVVVHADARGTGAGRELMNLSISKCYLLFGKGGIKIGAQLYLLKFYEALGFKQSGEIYLEDGIEHVEMILKSD